MVVQQILTVLEDVQHIELGCTSTGTAGDEKHRLDGSAGGTVPTVLYEVRGQK